MSKFKNATQEELLVEFNILTNQFNSSTYQLQLAMIIDERLKGRRPVRQGLINMIESQLEGKMEVDTTTQEFLATMQITEEEYWECANLTDILDMDYREFVTLINFG